MCARSEMMASVMPSAKYSCAGSWETFRNGSTAIARIASLAGRPCAGPDLPSRIRRRASPTVAAEEGRCAGSFRRQSPSSRSSSTGTSGLIERAAGAALLMIANISASGRCLTKGRWPVTISNSMTPSA